MTLAVSEAKLTLNQEQPTEALYDNAILSSTDLRTTSVKNQLTQTTSEFDAHTIYNTVAKKHKELRLSNDALKQLPLTFLPTKKQASACTGPDAQDPSYDDCKLQGLGMKLIINYLSKKVPNFRCYYCEAPDGNETELQAAITKMIQSDFTGKVAIIYKDVSHTFSLLFKKTDTHFNVCVADSFGSQSSSATLVSTIASKLESSLNIQVYALKLKRQRSFTGCSVFSLHDATQFFYAEHFFEDLEGNFGNVDGINWVYHLPPCLMRVTQSMTEIENYITHNENPRPFFISPYDLKSSSNNHKSFAASLAQSTRIDAEGKKYNMKLHDKLFRYTNTITQDMEDHSVEKLKDIAAQYELSNLCLSNNNV